MNEKNYSKVPVFENGLAQPVFPLTDGKTGDIVFMWKQITMWTEMEKEIL